MSSSSEVSSDSDSNDVNVSETSSESMSGDSVNQNKDMKESKTTPMGKEKSSKVSSSMGGKGGSMVMGAGATSTKESKGVKNEKKKANTTVEMSSSDGSTDESSSCTGSSLEQSKHNSGAGDKYMGMSNYESQSYASDSSRASGSDSSECSSTDKSESDSSHGQMHAPAIKSKEKMSGPANNVSSPAMWLFKKKRLFGSRWIKTNVFYENRHLIVKYIYANFRKEPKVVLDIEIPKCFVQFIRKKKYEVLQITCGKRKNEFRVASNKDLAQLVISDSNVKPSSPSACSGCNKPVRDCVCNKSSTSAAPMKQQGKFVKQGDMSESLSRSSSDSNAPASKDGSNVKDTSSGDGSKSDEGSGSSEVTDESSSGSSYKSSEKMSDSENSTDESSSGSCISDESSASSGTEKGMGRKCNSKKGKAPSGSDSDSNDK